MVEETRFKDRAGRTTRAALVKDNVMVAARKGLTDFIMKHHIIGQNMAQSNVGRIQGVWV